MEKSLKILLIALIILSGCKTSRKVASSETMASSSSTELNLSKNTQDNLKVDNDITSELETTTVTTTTEFYPPSEKSSSGTEQTGKASGVDEEKQGPIKSKTQTTTTTKKKEADKSKAEATSKEQENANAKSNNDTEVSIIKVEKTKMGMTQWKIIGGVVLFLLVLYFLVRKNIIRIPFLTKTVDRINKLSGLSKANKV